MLKEAIGTGTTLDEAQQAAVQELNAPIDADINFEVLDLPVKKTFGLFGGSPAKVKAYYEEKEEETAAAGTQKSPKKQEPKRPDTTPHTPKETPAQSERSAIDYSKVSDAVKKAHDYLIRIVNGMGIDSPAVEITQLDDEYYLNLKCDGDYSLIIGRRGETLDAIQYLVRLAANKGKGTQDYVCVSVNVGNYRQKRESTLREIAKKTAQRAIKYGKNLSLDPMNSFERRIVHTVIAEMQGVSSHSVGVDADRKVIITPEGGGRNNFKGNNKGGRGGNYKGGGNRGGQRHDNRPKNDSSEAKRPPKSDSQGSSLYEKIEPKN
ncbi:MAG: Jag N-terminal domain-containing protein [Oscillospiraceae bacterium]|jgi:spoIIIJ-associated protein|nr:Jag N-terminal domain-containing protein [Oscillospiraceae bacterium]